MNNREGSSEQRVRKIKSFQWRRLVSLMALLIAALGLCFSLLNQALDFLDQRIGWMMGMGVSLLAAGAYVMLYRCTWCGKFPETKEDLPSFNPDICDHCLSPLKISKSKKNERNDYYE